MLKALLVVLAFFLFTIAILNSGYFGFQKEKSFLPRFFGISFEDQPVMQARIHGWSFEEKLDKGKPIDVSGRTMHFKIEVENLQSETRDFLLSVVILHDNKFEQDLEFFSEQKITNLVSNEIIPITLEKEWIPKSAGSHSVEIRLLSLDKRTVFERFTDSLELYGEKNYSVSVSCEKKSVKPGETINSKTTVQNLGDYADEISLNIALKNSNGTIESTSSIGFSLLPGQEKVFSETQLVPSNHVADHYEVNADVFFNGIKKSDSCVFAVDKKTILDDILSFFGGFFRIS